MNVKKIQKAASLLAKCGVMLALAAPTLALGAKEDPRLARDRAKAERFAAMSADERNAFVREVQKQVMDLELMPPVVNMKPSQKYHGFDKLDFVMNAGMTRTRGGRLIAIWHAGEDGPSSFVVGTWSDDDGKTWQGTKFTLGSPEPLFHIGTSAPVHRSVLIANVWAAPDGSLRLYAYQAMNMFDNRGALFEIVCRDPDAAEPVWEPAKFLFYGSAHNKPSVLRDGTWIIPADFELCSYLRENAFHDLDKLRGCGVLASVDGGRTWRRRGLARPDDDPHYCEHSILERTDGRLHMVLRTGKGTMVSESADGGWTWTKPALPGAFRQPVSRCSCVRLQSGRWLLVKNGFTPMEIVTAKTGDAHKRWWASRARLTAFLSDDEGKTWKGGLRLDPRERVAYPDAFQAPDGSIYVTYDHDRNTKADQLLFAKFTEDDVLAGKLVTPGMSLQNVIFSEKGATKGR